IFDIKADSIDKLLYLTLINGKAVNGGTIVNEGNLSIADCIFEKNYATSYGGVIRSNSGNLTISNSKFNNNSAASYGGVIHSISTLVNISNSSFTNNKAGSGGGALYINGIQTANSTVTNSYFANNSVESDWGTAGSICIAYGSLINNTIINSTVSGSSGEGGAVYISVNSYLKNNTMINCSAVNGNYIYAGSSFNAKVTFNDATITNPKATVTATVTDDMGHPVYGGNIDFYTNGILLGTANVINGTATLKYTKLLENNGLYKLNGTSYYFINNLSNITNGTLTVNIDRTPKEVYVSTTGSDDTGEGSVSKPYLTISKAIHEAFSTSYYPIVHILEGTYSGDGNTNMSFTDIGVLSLIGEKYNKTIIDGGLVNWIFNFGQYTQVNMVNLTIQNANATDYSYPVLDVVSDLNMADCIFRNNYGIVPIIYAGDYGSKVTIKNLIFKDNQVSGAYYGPCFVYAGELDNCHFINNSNIGTSTGAMFGGALYSYNLTVRNSEFIDNSNQGTAGALFVNGPLTSINNTYSGNYAKEYGGALQAGTMASVNDTFCNNTALISGGAVFANGNITNATFRNNTAGTYGGALCSSGGLNLHNCAFNNNKAGTNGNDIYLTGSAKVGAVNLTFESLNSSVISNILKAYLTDSEGNIISGGTVTFYISGKNIGTAEVINGMAKISCMGFSNGIYEITGNYSLSDNVAVKSAVLNISAEIINSLDLYISPEGSDETGDGTEGNPYATIAKALSEGLEKTQNLTIHLLTGTYTGSGNLNLTLPNGVNLTIDGAGVNKTFLDGQKVNWAFTKGSGDGLIKLTNLTITNALAPSSSYAATGYGIVENYGKMLIENCAFINNNMTSVVNQRGGNITVKNTYFYNNTASQNGGAFANFGDAVIDNCLFVANSCGNYGSAIFNAYFQQSNAATLLVTNTIIRDTITTKSNGGAVYLGGISTFKNCYFTNNTIFDIYTSESSGQPYVTMINTTFYNSTGFGAYGGTHWSIYNSSFANLSKAINFVSSYNIIIDGCLFNNPLGLIIQGSSNAAYNTTISNSAILNKLTAGNGLYYLDNNWWGNNSKPTILPYLTNTPTVVLNKWIIMSLTSNNAPGLSQIINLAIKSTDGNKIYDYDVSKIPIPSEDKEFVFEVSNGTITPNSGNTTAQGINATYRHNQYGNQTINAVFNRSTVSLDIELYQLNTITTIILSNSTGRQGNVLVLTADVVEADSGSPVNDGEVEFFLGTRSIGKANVHNGRATLNWSIDQDKGDYQINVRYNGTDSYIFSENSAMFSVTSVNTTTTANLSNSSV
ncbi:hypothetical protein A9507_15450, partial [Methanobacterium sp. A39]